MVEQTDEIDRGNLESFTTLSVDFYGARTESSKSYYKENVSNVARTFTPIPLNWTWSEINALFITRGKELIPTHTKRYDDITPTEFMDETMKEYNVANYTGQKTA